jgi:nucleotide-binding universal stress UspA family protein
MPATPTSVHTLVVYGASERADTALGRLARAAVKRGDRVTVLSLAAQEPSSRCCDTRSVLWNQVCRDLAGADLARAARAAGAPGTVECDVLLLSGGRPADAVMREALARGADEIVLADPRAGGLGRLQRRRLRRLGPVPVTEGRAAG